MILRNRINIFMLLHVVNVVLATHCPSLKSAYRGLGCCASQPHTTIPSYGSVKIGLDFPKPDLQQSMAFRSIHGNWTGTCATYDANGDRNGAFASEEHISTSEGAFKEMTRSGSEQTFQWKRPIQYAVPYSTKVMSRQRTDSTGSTYETSAEGAQNALYMQGRHNGSLVESRLVTMRKTGTRTIKIDSTQYYTDGVPSKLMHCVHEKQTADVPAPADSETTTLTYPLCNTSGVNLENYPQWSHEDGYWYGNYSYFNSSYDPNYVPDRWNYPYDHYCGFIVGGIDALSYSQRNLFLYPPQTHRLCERNNKTEVSDEECGVHGAAKLFEADQTTQICDPMSPGQLSGPYGDLGTTTYLLGKEALLYQIWNTDKAGQKVLYQSQLTTITYEGGTDEAVRRTRTAQFFDTESGSSTQFSFYREVKLENKDVFLSKLNQKKSVYNVSDAALDAICSGGYDNVLRFLEGANEWNGTKYSCPLPASPNTAYALHVWTLNGKQGYRGYYPDDEVGLLLTAAHLAKIPGATPETLIGYGWVERVATPVTMWTVTGKAGWDSYYGDDPVTVGTLLTARHVSKIPQATPEVLIGYGWVERVVTPLATWTEAGQTGWSAYYPSDPVAIGTLLTPSQLSKSGSTADALVEYGWLELVAV